MCGSRSAMARWAACLLRCTGPWREKAVLELAPKRHFGGGTMGMLQARQCTEVLECNRRLYEREWIVRWEPHRLRPSRPILR